MLPCKICPLPYIVVNLFIDRLLTSDDAVIHFHSFVGGQHPTKSVPPHLMTSRLFSSPRFTQQEQQNQIQYNPVQPAVCGM
jgi:hypothetical protein